jgi:hypothetical protein
MSYRQRAVSPLKTITRKGATKEEVAKRPRDRQSNPLVMITLPLSPQKIPLLEIPEAAVTVVVQDTPSKTAITGQADQTIVLEFQGSSKASNGCHTQI